MKLIFIPMCFLMAMNTHAQKSIDWDGIYQLRLSDFQSPATQIGMGSVYSLYTGARMDFSFYMSNAEFVFTKNFNSRVNCTFNRQAASLVAPDSLIASNLLQFSRYDFDLSELYARKFRKKLFEGKGAFSSIAFFQPIYDEVQQELAERHTKAATLTDVGGDREKLNELHQEVLKEIETLADFCKGCKPKKKK